MNLLENFIACEFYHNHNNAVITYVTIHRIKNSSLLIRNEHQNLVYKNERARLTDFRALMRPYPA